jgi:hypothetical protein
VKRNLGTPRMSTGIDGGAPVSTRPTCPTVVRDFLAAGLVDHMHTAIVPIVLGRGVRLWDGLDGLEDDYDVESVSSPSGITHVTFSRS